MNNASGTYRSGKVFLDEPVDWPDGLQVVVEKAGIDFCVDGSAWDETPEGIRKWEAWFESMNPVFTGHDQERFEAELTALRDEQRTLLPKWEEKIGKLLK
jgi:hypothetical protein